MQARQRNLSTNTADFQVTGPYTGTPPAVEASLDGAAWTTLDANPTGGVYSGTLTLPTGQYTLFVRHSDDHAVTASVDYVTVGDGYAGAGQSNFHGRLDDGQDCPNQTFRFVYFGSDSVWRWGSELAAGRLIGSGVGQDAAGNHVNNNWPSGDPALHAPGAGGGCVMPLVADKVMAATGVPIFFVQCAMGGTSIGAGTPNWQPGADHADRSTLYGDLVYRIRQVGGVRAVLWLQGETDILAGKTAQWYATMGQNIASALAADVNAPLMMAMVMPMGAGTFLSATSPDQINRGIDMLWRWGTNVLRGPDFRRLLTDPPDYQHIRIAAKSAQVAEGWWQALNAAFYGGAWPVPTTETIEEHFATGTVASGNIGSLGWSFAGPAPGYAASDAGHPGVLRMTTGATTTVSAVFPRSAQTLLLAPTEDFSVTFRMAAGQCNPQTSFRFGLFANQLADPPATDGIYIENVLGEANLYAVCRLGGTQTRVALCPADTFWHEYTISRKAWAGEMGRA